MSEHKPFIADNKKIPELTVAPIIIGCILGIIFGGSSLYLALKVGLTVSASIPVAVLSITLFRGLSRAFNLRKATILENNIVQTTGSAGESIAFGVAVTMPALLILGHDMELWRIMTVAVLGGLLGILMMVPLRHALIVESKMPFPEGTACAEVLIAGEKGGMTAKTVFMGFFVGLAYKFANVGMKLWTDVAERSINFFKGASVSCEVSPELLGVGYIIGPRNGCIMVAGGILSSWLLIPAIKLFGGGLLTPLFPATKLISEMSVHDVWRSYVLYIGAGAVAAAGIMSMVQNMPMIIRSATAGIKSFKSSKSSGAAASEKRTERDLPLSFVVIGSLVLVTVISLVPSLHMNLMGAILIIVFGFLFVTVSSRLTGDVGSSSNPVSGMTVATLLMTSLIFLFLGWTSPSDRITALSIAAIVCVACSNGGTTAQDLKTGYLVGGTPRSQQIAILFGAFTSAIVIGYTLNLLNDASTIYSKQNLPAITVSNVAELTKMEKVQGPEGKSDSASYHVLRVIERSTEGPLANVPEGKYLINDDGTFAYLVDPGINGVLKTRDDGSSVPKYEAPKARLMSLIIDGILTQKLPWSLVLLGVAIAILMEVCGIGSTLTFAVGVYLPLSTSMPIFIGGMVRHFVQKMTKEDSGDDTSPGILYSSGLIAGGSIAGIGLALLAVYEGIGDKMNIGKNFAAIANSNWTAVIMFTIMIASVFKVGSKKLKG